MPSPRRARPATMCTFQSLAAPSEQVGDAVARRLFFAAREQHVNAVEIGFGRGGIEAERLIKGAARVHHVNLAAEAVAHILQLGNAQAAPCRPQTRGPSR